MAGRHAGINAQRLSGVNGKRAAINDWKTYKSRGMGEVTDVPSLKSPAD